MPSEKELLAATVKATAKLFKRTEAIKKIRTAIETETRRTEAQEAARTVGETLPEGET